MNQNLNSMTMTELKRYISALRNNEEAFRSALQVLIKRSESSITYPSPLKMSNPEVEMQAVFREKLRRIEQNGGQS